MSGSGFLSMDTMSDSGSLPASLDVAGSSAGSTSDGSSSPATAQLVTLVPVSAVRPP